ncbi:MAG: SLC13 family permease [Neofamilia sp.]
MDQAIIALIILLVTTVILVKEYIPLGGVGLLLAVSMVLFGILDATSSLVYFSNKTVIQVAVAYIISEAVLVVGVADKIGDLAQSISSKQKDSERTVLILVMVTTALSGLILPRFAVTAALMPIVIAIARSTGVSRTKLLFLLALTANFAGQNTLMSTPPNMLANGILADAGYNTFGYFEFAWIGMPMTIAGVIVVALLQKKILPEYVDEKLIASSEQLGMGADPRAVVMAITCGCGSSFMTPIVTPSNTMVMEEAKLKFKDFAIAGTPLMIVTFILVMIILPMVWPFFP